MTTTYVVFDMAQISEPEQTANRHEAMDWFAERKMDGDDVVLIGYEIDHSYKPTKRYHFDWTVVATEYAAEKFLKDSDWNADETPHGWVYRSDYYDQWREDKLDAAFDAKRMREQGVA